LTKPDGEQSHAATSLRAATVHVCYTFAAMHTAHTPAVEAVNLTRQFGEVTALDSVSLSVARGEFFSLLGPSGCGKTSLLRLIAGLDFPDGGSLRLNGEDAIAIPAQHRAVNTVFQSYALFPHLNVRENIAFGLRMKKVARTEIETRVRGVMELVRVTELAARQPAQLSGGQKQRVALARALVNEPQVLLLDEPLAALDLKLRKELQQELRSLQRRTGVTFIYVTHDQDEALSMSDRIAVMDHGRIAQLGTGEELYERPRTRFVAQFLGGCNLLTAKVRERGSNGMVVQTPIGDLRLAANDSRAQFTLAIRPEKILLHQSNTPNTLAGDVLETTYTGAETHSIVRVGSENLRVVSVNNGHGPRLASGQPVQLTLSTEALVALED
jgi:spermidine/putrescine transport system ATP-binding protein